MADPTAEPANAIAFREKVIVEIRQLQAYFRNRLRWYRWLSVVVIAAAAAVPVLAAISGIPRAVIGLVGATATAAEAVKHLFQFRPVALSAMQTSNALERELNGYLLAIKGYAIERPMREERLYERIEDIRAAQDGRFFETLRSARDGVPGIADGRTSKGREVGVSDAVS